ncbi:Uncharacterized protein SCF082_LOCUS640 [Durusdinium trenchii]|uniref:Uncharacterized protein n=1 Tax=Durusdinium trenchii TaxID=1381693 RepID=A0ABP0HAA9_9DINO
MKLISEIFHENCDGDGKMTPDTLRELLQSLCDQHVGLWDPTDVDNVLANWADKGSIDFDDFLSRLDERCGDVAIGWVYHDSAMLSPRDASSASPRHLTINFDVLLGSRGDQGMNKTIVMRDKTANKSVEVVINEVLAETSWGRVVEDQWMIVSTRPSSLRPEVDGEELVLRPMVSYAEFLEQRLPGSDRRKERQKHKGAFTAPGSVGEPMAQHHRNLCKQLVYPDGSPVQVVHAFFRLLVELKRSKRSFSLIFRSFGEDLELVAQELNSFCEGKHPLFPGFRMDGSDGEPDYRFHITHPERFGNFHIENEDLHLVLGTIEQPGEGRYKDVADRSLTFYETHQLPVTRIISGMSAVVDFIWELSAQCLTAGFRDNFQYWKMKGHTQEGGKFFLFDASRSTLRHEIFFDDNVHFQDLKIVRPYHRMRQRRSWWGLPLLRTHVWKA